MPESSGKCFYHVDAERHLSAVAARVGCFSAAAIKHPGQSNRREQFISADLPEGEESIPAGTAWQQEAGVVEDAES